MKKVIIIGAGFGGLSLAALLAKDGYEVSVVEKHDQPGGRARMWETNGYRFDMGPSWYMMPEVFEQYFAYFDKKPSDYYTLERLDPQYRLFFEKDEVLDISADMQKNLKLFDQLEENGAEKFQTYLKKAQELYDLSMGKFIYRDYSSFKDFLHPDFREAGIPSGLLTNMEKFISKTFTNDRLKKILLYTVVFLGGNPKNTPAVYSLMSHVDFNLGVWYPKGGLNAVAKGMEKLAKEHGVRFFYNSEVEKILTEGNKAIGVKTTTGEYLADTIISNADYAHTELDLLEEPQQTYNKAYWEKRTWAPSAFIMYLGLNKKIDALDHHNLVLANDWQKHFDEIFDDPKWPDRPSYYICCPSKTETDMAPEGKENLFVLVPAAIGLDDSDEEREAYAEKILKDMEAILGASIKDSIEVKRIFSQRDFSAEYHSYKGTALGLAQTLKQSALFRPARKSKKLEGLYYSGQFTHPGIGVPMVVISAEITRDILKQEHAS